MILTFLWGFFEATCFFIIPDVILTLIAIHGFREGLDASLLSLVGALIGGSIMYIFAARNFTAAYTFVHRVPAISKNMLDNVEQSVKEKGIIAMIVGPIRGIPYKAFAIYAPKVGIRFSAFLIASVPARFIRFFLTSILAWYLANVLFKQIPMVAKYSVWAVIWVIVYILYFSIHGKVMQEINHNPVFWLFCQMSWCLFHPFLFVTSFVKVKCYSSQNRSINAYIAWF